MFMLESKTFDFNRKPLYCHINIIQKLYHAEFMILILLWFPLHSWFDYLHNKVPMGHGQIPNQTVFEEYLRDRHQGEREN